MHWLFSCISIFSYFRHYCQFCVDASFDRHLHKTTPYMGQVLSPMGAHSVSGETLLLSPNVIQGVPGEQKERFIVISNVGNGSQIWPEQCISLLSMHQWPVSPKINQRPRFFLSKKLTVALALARIRCFATFGRTRCDPPLRFQTKRRRAWRKRPADCSHRVLAIGGIIFGQYLTQLWQVKGQILGNSMIFFNSTSPYQQNYLS